MSRAPTTPQTPERVALAKGYYFRPSSDPFTKLWVLCRPDGSVYSQDWTERDVREFAAAMRPAVAGGTGFALKPAGDDLDYTPQEIIELKERRQSALKEVKFWMDECQRLREAVTHTVALAEFAREAIRDICWDCGNGMDGGGMQDFAEKLGLLVPHIVTDEEAQEGLYGDVPAGEQAFRFAPFLEESVTTININAEAKIEAKEADFVPGPHPQDVTP